MDFLKKKDQKLSKEKVRKAIEEIDKFNFESLFKEPRNNPTNNDYNRLVNIALIRAAEDMPNTKDLLPDLFTITSGSGAVDARLASNGTIYRGIIPSNFYFALGNQNLIDNNKGREALKKKVQEINLQNIKESVEKMFEDVEYGKTSSKEEALKILLKTMNSNKDSFDDVRAMFGKYTYYYPISDDLRQRIMGSGDKSTSPMNRYIEYLKGQGKKDGETLGTWFQRILPDANSFLVYSKGKSLIIQAE